MLTIAQALSSCCPDCPKEDEKPGQSACDNPAGNHVRGVARFGTPLGEINHEPKRQSVESADCDREPPLRFCTYRKPCKESDQHALQSRRTKNLPSVRLPWFKKDAGTIQCTEHSTNQYDNGHAHLGVLGEPHQ